MTVPAAPTGFTATSEVASVALSWTAPGGPVLGYNVYQSTSSGEYLNCVLLAFGVATCADVITSYATCADLIKTPLNGGTLLTGTTAISTGLTNGTAYHFVVVAVNATGPSFPTSEASATPALQAPQAPTSVTAVAGNAKAVITWTPPYNGGSAITGFTVTNSSGGTATAGASATSLTMTGLTNWAPYTFTVKATNAIGTGPNSAPSNQITPEASPGKPTVTAVFQYDPISGVPEILITITADVTAASPDAVLTATVIRNDGVYVLGASPLDPLPVTISDPVVTIVDFTAPYGVESSYVSNVTFSSTGPPVVTPPSKPAGAVMGQAPDTVELYNRLGWAQDEDASGQLLQWLSGLGQMVQTVDSLCRDGYDTDGNLAPGWSQLLDINRCPTYALPWLAQFVGVTLDPTLRDDQMRYEIENPAGWARGTTGAIIAAANKYLAPGFSVSLAERDTSPYHLTITVPTDGYRGSTTCLQLSREYATCADLITQFATCAAVWGSTPSGAPSGASTCLVIEQTYATCALFTAAYATCAAVWEVDFFIIQAIQDTVPAGIQVTTVFT